MEETLVKLRQDGQWSTYLHGGPNVAILGGVYSMPEMATALQRDRHNAALAQDVPVSKE